MRRSLSMLGLVGLGLLATGCGSGRDSVIEAWKKAGQTPGEFKDVGEKLPGGKCSSGRVAGVDTTLCEFPGKDEAKKAEDAGWELVGSAVGSCVTAGKLVLVIADPRKEDPSGRRMNELIQAFQKAAR